MICPKSDNLEKLINSYNTQPSKIDSRRNRKSEQISKDQGDGGSN